METPKGVGASNTYGRDWPNLYNLACCSMSVGHVRALAEKVFEMLSHSPPAAAGFGLVSVLAASRRGFWHSRGS